VWAADLRADALTAPCVALDATNATAVRALVKREGIREVYQLVAMLSVRPLPAGEFVRRQQRRGASDEAARAQPPL
jgi:hypothetical protein